LHESAAPQKTIGLCDCHENVDFSFCAGKTANLESATELHEKETILISTFEMGIVSHNNFFS
jgi:hypothetical protein